MMRYMYVQDEQYGEADRDTPFAAKAIASMTEWSEIGQLDIERDLFILRTRAESLT